MVFVIGRIILPALWGLPDGYGITGMNVWRWKPRVREESLDKMVQMLREQRFIWIEDVEIKEMEVEVESGFYVK